MTAIEHDSTDAADELTQALLAEAQERFVAARCERIKAQPVIGKADIAALLGCAERSVNDWFERVAAAGMDIRQPLRGRYLTADVMTAMHF